MLRRMSIVALLFVSSVLGNPAGANQDPCHALERHLEISDFFFKWVSGVESDVFPALFWDETMLCDAARIGFHCPFVPPEQITAIDSRFFSGFCCAWNSPTGQCVHVSLTIVDESEDEVTVRFFVNWGDLAGIGYYYSCCWEDDQLIVERVPNRILVS